VLKDELKQYQALGDWAAEDGNRDGIVDERDLELAQNVATSWGLSSFYDVNQDGLTNAEDIKVIAQAIAAKLGIPVPALPVFSSLLLAFFLWLLARRRLARLA